MAGFQVVLGGMKPFAAKLQEKSQEDFLNCCKRATLLLRNNARKKTPVAKSAVYQDAAGNTIGQHKGGGLRRSLRLTMPSETTDGEVGYTIHYAPHVEYGHRQAAESRLCVRAVFFAGSRRRNQAVVLS